MGFALAPTEKFTTTVTVNVKQENGAWRQDSFQAVFLRLPESKREEYIQMKYVDLLRDRLVDWKMKDDNGQDVPFTVENFEALLNMTGAVRESAQAFWLGNTGAREKN